MEPTAATPSPYLSALPQQLQWQDLKKATTWIQYHLKYFYMNYWHISDRIFSWKTINNADKCIFFIICNLKILTFQIWQKMLEADFIQFGTSSLERLLIILSTYFYNSQIQVSYVNYSFSSHFSFIISSCLLSWMSKSSFFNALNIFFEKISKALFTKRFCNALPELRR